jgi:hypothetical protein
VLAGGLSDFPLWLLEHPRVLLTLPLDGRSVAGHPPTYYLPR